MTDSAMPTDDSSDNGKHPYRRILMKSLTLALLLGCGLLVYLTPLKSWLEQGQMIVAQLAALGYWAPLAYVLAGAVLAAAGVPRMLICSLGGLAFGFVWGLAWSHLATLLVPTPPSCSCAGAAATGRWTISRACAASPARCTNAGCWRCC
ncbi:hypothetical protein [Methylogaea oryzae]|uniref:hypothetical protein n=1 Tax=Methylogaea oryzae TaxID=1295382 RepID=UPI0006D11289|nr:hypothetical protein [Methylogaea oryzae]